MIDATQALADLDALPGELVAVPKGQMRDLLGELARRQRATPPALSLFSVAALLTPASVAA